MPHDQSPHAPSAPRRRSRRVDRFHGNVFIANLPRGFTDEQLAQTFDGFGLVLGAFLARDPETRATMTYGLVDIAPASAAPSAVAALNGTTIGGRKVEVRMSDPTMSLTVPMAPGASQRLSRPPRPPRAAPRAPVQVEYRSLARRY